MNLIWQQAVSQSELMNSIWNAVKTGDAVEFTRLRERLLQAYFPQYNSRWTAVEAEANLPEEIKEELSEAWKMVFLPPDEAVVLNG